MADQDLQELLQDISERVQAIAGFADEEQIKRIIDGRLDELSGDREFVRKLRFGKDPEQRKLVGTKFARWGLTPADVEFAFDMLNSARGLPTPSGGTHPGPSEELTRTFRAISDARYLPEDQVREMDRRAIDDVFPRIPLHEFYGEDRDHAARGEFELTGAYQQAVRAMDTAEAGYGEQLIGAQYVGELWEAPRRLGRVFNLIPTFEMTDPTAYLPVESDLPEMLFVSESTANNSSNYSTTKTGSRRVQVDAKKFVIHQMWSGEMEEDSIIPFIPFIRRQAALSIAFHSDSLVLNGDTTNAGTGNINLDDADPADTKHYLAFDGIRHAGLVDNTDNGKDAAGPVSLPLLSRQRGRMLDVGAADRRFMDWGHPIDMNDLVRACDPETADEIALMDDVLTVDKYGPQATVLNGELARVQGNPLVSTPAVSKTEADGKVSTTASNNTKGQVVAFNRRGFVAGWRRRVRVETERIPATDQTRIVYSLRLGFGRFSPTGSASGIEAADVLYNITIG